MGQLIRTFLHQCRERKYWKTRLEPVIDRLLHELENKEVATQNEYMQDEPRTQSVPPQLQQSEGEFSEDTNAEQEASSSSQESELQETTSDPEEQDEENQKPMMVFPPISLDDILSSLLQKQMEEGDQNLSPSKEEDQIALPSTSLENLQDTQVDELKPLLQKIVRQIHKGKRTQITHAPAPRRKNVDPRNTVREMARNGGAFTGFRYQPSPSEKQTPVDLQHLLVIADVSGSMGRYVGIVLYLLACLEGIADVDSYVFSDETTYASNLLGEGSFDEQFTRLREGAASWEYGTQLANALQAILLDKRFEKKTRVVLITDGGFSLVGSDWIHTVERIRLLKESVDQLLVVTPNPDLWRDGPVCEEKLWNVERDPRHGYEIVGLQQRVARFGLLTRYSDQLLRCQTPEDLVHVIQAVLEDTSS